MKKGFDSKKYLKAESLEILKRLNLYDRLYLEVGGKLFYDGHASRVLPGYDQHLKIKIIKELGDIDLIYCVNAKDLSSLRHLGDFDLNYKKQVLKDLKDIKKSGLRLSFVCITRFDGEKGISRFKEILKKLGVKVYVHNEIKNYEKGVSNVLKGFSKEKYIPVKKKIVVVTGASGGSAKMATALNQIYLEKKKKIKSGFAKVETFPIWNLLLNHPVNIVYEAATADLGDVNMIDKYYKKKYGKIAVNYNRDLYNFKILNKLDSSYNSPTEMGINMAKEGIIDDGVCRKAALKEIRRRWKIYSREVKKGRESVETLNRMMVIMKKVGL